MLNATFLSLINERDLHSGACGVLPCQRSSAVGNTDNLISARWANWMTLRRRRKRCPWIQRIEAASDAWTMMMMLLRLLLPRRRRDMFQRRCKQQSMEEEDEEPLLLQLLTKPSDARRQRRQRRRRQTNCCCLRLLCRQQQQQRDELRLQLRRRDSPIPPCG